jgi:hypothetical protein
LTRRSFIEISADDSRLLITTENSYLKQEGDFLDKGENMMQKKDGGISFKLKRGR